MDPLELQQTLKVKWSLLTKEITEFKNTLMMVNSLVSGVSQVQRKVNLIFRGEFVLMGLIIFMWLTGEMIVFRNLMILVII